MLSSKGFVVLILILAVVALALTAFIPPQTYTVEYKSGFPYAETDDTLKLYVRIAVSALFAGAGLFVVLSKKYDANEQNWAFATMGTVVGFWLKD
jgi:hypothetical protein